MHSYECIVQHMNASTYMNASCNRVIGYDVKYQPDRESVSGRYRDTYNCRVYRSIARIHRMYTRAVICNDGMPTSLYAPMPCGRHHKNGYKDDTAYRDTRRSAECHPPRARRGCGGQRSIRSCGVQALKYTLPPAAQAYLSHATTLQHPTHHPCPRTRMPPSWARLEET